MVSLVTSKDKDIPLCGIPYFTIDNYLKKVIRRGLKVAVCDQVEVGMDWAADRKTPAEAKKRGKKRKSPVLDRAVVRLISAGTLVEEAFLSPRQSNFLCSLSSSPDNSHFGFSVIDISTGEVAVHNIEESHLSSLLARYDPHEILISSYLQDHLPASLRGYLGTNSQVTLDSQDVTSDSTAMGCSLTVVDDPYWDDSSLPALVASREELEVLQTPITHHDYSAMEQQSLSALLAYINTMQMGRYPSLFFTDTEQGNALELDKNTRDSLNLTRGYRNTAVGSVLHVATSPHTHTTDTRPHCHRHGQSLPPQPPLVATHRRRRDQQPSRRGGALR